MGDGGGDLFRATFIGFATIFVPLGVIPYQPLQSYICFIEKKTFSTAIILHLICGLSYFFVSYYSAREIDEAILG